MVEESGKAFAPWVFQLKLRPGVCLPRAQIVEAELLAAFKAAPRLVEVFVGESDEPFRRAVAGSVLDEASAPP